MDTDQWFQVQAVVPLAFERLQPGQDPSWADWGAKRSVGDHARLMASRVGWDTHDVKEALRALVDAVTWLERELEDVTRRLHLTRSGLDLQEEILGISAGGCTLQRDLGWPPQTEAQLYLAIPVRGRSNLVSLRARVVDPGPGSTNLVWTDIRLDQRDMLVAFVFQQQAKERRRVLAAADDALRDDVLLPVVGTESPATHPARPDDPAVV